MRAWLLMGVMVMSSVVAAFDPPVAKVGDFTLRIDAPNWSPNLKRPSLSASIFPTQVRKLFGAKSVCKLLTDGESQALTRKVLS
jgi:hypothetical protein